MYKHLLHLTSILSIFSTFLYISPYGFLNPSTLLFLLNYGLNHWGKNGFTNANPSTLLFSKLRFNSSVQNSFYECFIALPPGQGVERGPRRFCPAEPCPPQEAPPSEYQSPGSWLWAPDVLRPAQAICCCFLTSDRQTLQSCQFEGRTCGND